MKCLPGYMYAYVNTNGFITIADIWDHLEMWEADDWADALEFMLEYAE